MRLELLNLYSACAQGEFIVHVHAFTTVLISDGCMFQLLLSRSGLLGWWQVGVAAGREGAAQHVIEQTFRCAATRTATNSRRGSQHDWGCHRLNVGVDHLDPVVFEYLGAIVAL